MCAGVDLAKHGGMPARSAFFAAFAVRGTATQDARTAVRAAFAARVLAAALPVIVLVAMLAPAPAIAQPAACAAPPGEPPCVASDGPASQSDSGGIDVAIGNPVHALTGAKAQTEFDAAPAPGVLGLEIRRHYSSAYATVDGPFGAGWTLSYDTRLHRVGKTAQIIQADGRRIIFQVGGRSSAPTCTAERPDDGDLNVLVSSPEAIAAAGDQSKADQSKADRSRADRSRADRRAGIKGASVPASAATQAAARVTGYRWRWPDGREIDFDERGLLTGIRQSGPDGQTLALRVTRNVEGLIESVIDPHGRSMRLHYDDSGRALRIDHPRGTWRYQVGNGGALQAVTAPNGAVRRYEYAEPPQPFRLTAIRQSESASSSGYLVANWTYGSDGRVTEAVVPRIASFDAGSLGAGSLGAGPVDAGPPVRYRFEYGLGGEDTTRVTTTGGDWIRYRHRTIAGRIRPVTIESAACTTCPSDHRLLAYDSAGRIIRTQWRPASSATAGTAKLSDIGFERDDRGRVTRIVAGGHDLDGKPRWIRRFEYAQGTSSRPTLIARPSVEPGREHRLILTWGDTAATRERLVSVDEQGYREGRPITRTLHYRHDDTGQLAAIDGPLPGDDDLFRVIHDPRRPGRVIGLLDPLGRAVPAAQMAGLLRAPAWAGLGGLPDPDPTRFEVTSGEVVHRALNGATTRLIVDDFGRTVRVISDDAGIERLEYDEADRVVRNTDATGAAVSLRHDAAGRPLERVVTAPGREPEVTRYRYGTDRTTTVEHPVASEVVRHDDAGRVIERTVTLHVGPAAGTTFTRRFRYRGAERKPAEIDLPDGTRLAFGAGADRSAQWTGHGSSAAIELWQRHSAGAGLRVDLGNGVTRTLIRDAKGRLASIEDSRGEAVITRRALTYDRQGRIEAIDDGQGGWHYAYDSRGRLIIAQPGGTGPSKQAIPGSPTSRSLASGTTAPAKAGGAGNGALNHAAMDQGGPAKASPDNEAAEQASWWYAHDDNGNRLLVKAPAQRVEPPAETPALLPADASEPLLADRPIRLAYGKASDRVQGPEYDPAGRPLRWRGMDLSWHPGGRIATVASDGRIIARYYYNHRGERVAKEVGSDWTYFDYEGGRLVGQKRHGEPGMRHFLHDGELPAVMIDARPAPEGLVDRLVSHVGRPAQALLGRADVVRWLHLDHRGAPIATSDAQGRVVWTARLSPDGERLPESSTGPDAEDPRLRLPGQYHDPETDLHDNLHRTYDPRIGRYLSPDPLGLRAGSNPYRYAGGDPINHVDPTGLLLFAFDGTRNSDTDRTNVRQMWDLYAEQDGEPEHPGGINGHYEPGIGTTGSDVNRGWQAVTADEWKVAVDRQFDQFLQAVARLEPGDQLFIDVVGFSRGAIQARAFGQRVARALRDGTIPNAGQVTLRFMGLYDAVQTNIFDGMTAHQIHCLIGIAPEWQHVTHLVAINEHRPLFSATLLGRQEASSGVRHEIALVGAHSNIGGGYDPALEGAPAPRDRSDLSNVALWVMLEEARQIGVQFNPLAPEQRQASNPILNDQTHGSGGDPYRFVLVDGEHQPLANAGVGGMTRADSRAVGAPGHRLPNWHVPPNVPPGSGPNVVGTIDITAYCERLVRAEILSRCPP